VGQPDEADGSGDRSVHSSDPVTPADGSQSVENQQGDMDLSRRGVFSSPIDRDGPK
jgi:hypothetical protein